MADGYRRWAGWGAPLLALLLLAAACQGGSPRGAGGCRELTRQGALNLLGKVALLPNPAALPHTTGVFRTLAEDEVAAVAAGWPTSPETRDNPWRANAWVAVKLEPQGEEVVVRLGHRNLIYDGISGDTSENTFLLRCVSGTWKVANIGWDNGRKIAWYSEARYLPGQDGDLTRTLVKQLQGEAISAYGLFKLHRFVTGREEAYQKAWALALNTGYSRKPWVWPGEWGSEEEIELTGPGEAVSRNKEDGRYTGEETRFRRVDGVWKLEHHTEAGRWVSPDLSDLWRPFGDGRSDDDSVLGMTLGLSREAVAAKILPESLPARGITLVYTGDRVSAITATSGLTPRGLYIGASRAELETLYGRPTREDGAELLYRSGPNVLWVRLENGRISAFGQR